MAAGVSDLAVKVGIDATRLTQGMRKAGTDIRSIEKSINPANMSLRRMRTEAMRVFMDTRTPLERYSLKLQRLSVLYLRGANDADTYRRAVQRETLAYQQATAKQSRFLTGMASMGRSLLAFVAPSMLVITGIYKMVGALRSAEEMTAGLNASLAILPRSAERYRKAMTATAFDVAHATGHSASEVGKAYFYLESAGMNAQQSIVAMPQVAKFARAGMFELSRATDLATDAQKALGMSSEDAQKNLKQLTRVTDVLVKANTLGNATVEQFSQSLTSKAGAAFRLVGKSIEEGTATLIAFANQGVKAEEAGTQLTRLMVNLKVNAIKEADAFDKFGISVYDAVGNMRNMADIIGDMEKAFSGLSDREKQAAIMMLGFDKRSADVAAVLLGTSKEIRKFQQELEAAGGTTEDVAERQLPPLTKAWRQLTNAISEITRGPLTAGLEGIAKEAEAIARAAHGFKAEPLSLRDMKELQERIRNMDVGEFERASEQFAKYGVDMRKFLGMADDALYKHQEAISATQNALDNLTISLSDMTIQELQKLQRQTQNIFEQSQLAAQWAVAQREKKKGASFAAKMPAERLLPIAGPGEMAAHAQSAAVIAELDENIAAQRNRRILAQQQAEDNMAKRREAAQKQADEMAKQAHEAQKQQAEGIARRWQEAEDRLRGITREQRAIMGMEGQQQAAATRQYERRLQIEKHLKDMEAGKALREKMQSPRDEARAKLREYGRLLSVGAIDLGTAQQAVMRDVQPFLKRAGELRGPSMHEVGTRGAAEAIMRHEQTAGRQDAVMKSANQALRWLQQIAQNTNPQSHPGGVTITPYPSS